MSISIFCNTKYHILQKILLSFLTIAIFSTATARENVKVKILCTTDTHGALKNGDFRDTTGGYLQLAALIRTERQNSPTSPLLIDCGDIFQGSLPMSKTEGSMGTDIINFLNYDIVVLGNHDFEYADHIIRRNLEAITPTCKILAANLHSDYTKRIQEYQIFTRNGVKIAVIGTTLDDLPFRVLKSEQHIQMITEAAALKKIIPELRKQHCNIIIWARHGGEFGRHSQVYKILRFFPEIDLVLGGHTHVAEPGKNVRNAWFVQSGKHAQYLGVVEIEYSIPQQQIIRISSELKDAANVPADLELLQALRQKYPFINSNFDQPVIEFRALPGKSSPLAVASLGARAMAHAYPNSITLYGVSGAPPIPKLLSEQKLFDLFPYQDTLINVTLNGAELQEIITEQYAVKAKRKYYFALHGVRLNPTGKNKFSLPPEILSSSAIECTFASYAASGGGGLFLKLEKILRRHGVRNAPGSLLLRNLVKEFLLANPHYYPDQINFVSPPRVP